MNIFKKKIIASLLLLFISLSLPLNVFADNKTLSEQRIVVLNQNEIINHDYFAAGNRIIIDGIVNGDVYIAGGQIDINGTINGDLLSAGGQINVRGNISQSIRAVGGNMLIDGTVGKNISLAGGMITIGQNAKIAGNAVIAAGNSEILSPLKELALAGGTFRLSSHMGNVNAGIGTIELTPQAVVDGNLNYWSNNKAVIAPEAKVGSIVFHQTSFNKPTREDTKRTFPAVNLFFEITAFISSLVVGIIFIMLFPVFSQKTASGIVKKFWLNLLIGIIAIILIPIITILFAITLIGIPFAVFLSFAYIFMIYIAKLLAALTIGSVINARANWHMSLVWSFIIGLAIYHIVGLIPIAGGLMKLIAMFVGIGAFIMQEKYSFETLRNKKLI